MDHGRLRFAPLDAVDDVLVCPSNMTLPIRRPENLQVDDTFYCPTCHKRHRVVEINPVKLKDT